MYPARLDGAGRDAGGGGAQLVGADAVHVFPHPPRLAGRAPRPHRRPGRRAVRPPSGPPATVADGALPPHPRRRPRAGQGATPPPPPAAG